MRGAWIEIENTMRAGIRDSRRSPCGERGLKSFLGILVNLNWLSLPMRGAWIEI